jgi:hypothetical protein
MHWFDPPKARTIPRGVALRDDRHAPQGSTGEPTRVGEGSD